MGLSDGLVAFLSIFLTGLFIAGTVYGLYQLHTRGIMEVRIPRIFRCLWCKDYLSPEEKDEIKRLDDLRKSIATKQELNRRLAAKATIRGFPLDDSMFGEHENLEAEEMKEKLSREAL